MLVSRKLVHIGASGVVFLFAYVVDDPATAIGLIVAVTAVALADRRLRVFRGIQSRDDRNMGTIWFWVALLVAVPVLWDEPGLMVAAVIPMAIGDPLAGLVGTRWGRRSYHVAGHVRTVEGTAAFAASTSVLTFLALLALTPPPQIDVVTAVLLAVAIASLGAAIEAASHWGVDNLAVTVAAVLILLVLA